MMLLPMRYDETYIPKLNYKPNDYIVAKITKEDGEGYKRTLSVKMRVIDVYPHIIRCEDIDGNIECFNVADIYTGVISRID